MATLITRIEKLEQAASVAPASPSLAVVLQNGLYRLPDGREVAHGDFEREFPDADVMRVTGFEGV